MLPRSRTLPEEWRGLTAGLNCLMAAQRGTDALPRLTDQSSRSVMLLLKPRSHRAPADGLSDRYERIAGPEMSITVQHICIKVTSPRLHV